MLAIERISRPIMEQSHDFTRFTSDEERRERRVRVRVRTEI